MMRQTIPHGRDLKVTYYHGVIGNVQAPRMRLSRYVLELILLPDQEYNNMRNVWVACNIANTVQDINSIFECDMIPVDGVFIVTSTTGESLRFKLYDNNVLVQL